MRLFIDIKKIIDEINNIRVSLSIKNINYVIAKEEVYDSLKPWNEADDFSFLIDMQIVENKKDFDLYIEQYEIEYEEMKKQSKKYYIKNS